MANRVTRTPKSSAVPREGLRERPAIGRRGRESSRWAGVLRAGCVSSAWNSSDQVPTLRLCRVRGCLSASSNLARKLPDTVEIDTGDG